MARKMQEDKFDLNDMLDQLRQIQKMGNLKSILSMLPGVGNQLKDVDIDERQFSRVEAIILSMTREERTKPDILNPSRKRRIAAGCGLKVEDVNRLVKQYDSMRQLMKQVKGMGKKGPGFPPGHGPSRRHGAAAAASFSIRLPAGTNPPGMSGRIDKYQQFWRY